MLMLAAALLCVPCTVAAQTDPTDSVQETATDARWNEHGGFTINFGLGAGWVSAGGCGACGEVGGLAVDSSIGWFWGPRVALLFDVFALTTSQYEIVTSTANAMSAFAVQFWVTPRFWVKGGVGYDSFMAATFLGTARTGGGGMTLGAGYEILHGGGNFGFDVHLRLSSADIGDINLINFAVLAGFNWH